MNNKLERFQTGSTCIDFCSSRAKEAALREASKLDEIWHEREDMSTMINKLEKAQEEMLSQLKEAKYEARALKRENAASIKLVSSMAWGKAELMARLGRIEETRGDVRLQLKEAKDDVQKLKKEKLSKEKEFMRLKTRYTTSMY